MDFLRNESIVHSGQIRTDCLLRMCLDDSRIPLIFDSIYDYCFSLCYISVFLLPFTFSVLLMISIGHA